MCERHFRGELDEYMSAIAFSFLVKFSLYYLKFKTNSLDEWNCLDLGLSRLDLDFVKDLGLEDIFIIINKIDNQKSKFA